MKIHFLLQILLPCIVLSGCQWFSKKRCCDKSHASSELQVPIKEVSATNETLLSFNGEPVITKKDFEEHLDTIISVNPQIREIIHSVPAIRCNVFSGMVSRELLKKWAETQNLKNNSDFKKDFKTAVALLEYEIIRKYFQEDLQSSLEVSDADINEYYQTYKTKIPDFLISPGGVKAVGVVFDNGISQAGFAQACSYKKADLQTYAQRENLPVVDFGMVTPYSVALDKTLRTSLLEDNIKPGSIVLVKTEDKKFWVCRVTAREEPKYCSLEIVKDAIRKTLLSEKIKIVYGQKLEALKTVYGAQENTSYFEKISEKKEQESLQQDAKEAV